jgi:hypothetical protein
MDAVTASTSKNHTVVKVVTVIFRPFERPNAEISKSMVQGIGGKCHTARSDANKESDLCLDHSRGGEVEGGGQQ